MLRALVASSSVSRIGRGVFFAITVLYFTQILGLTGTEAALVLAIASGTGVLASLLGGWLADRWSARRMTFAFEALGGALLVAYAFAGDFASALIIACTSNFFDTLGHSSRSAIIARGFTADKRVFTRAVLRTVTNVSIAVGAGIAAIALAIGTGASYRAVIIVAGVLGVLGSLPLLGLPARVDAPARNAEVTEIRTETGSIDTVAQGEAERASRREWNRRSPWRDPRYLLLALLSAVFGMQFGVAEVGVPLWVTSATEAPEVIVAVLLIVNTTLVVIFQVPLSRGTHDVRTAGRVTMIAGWLMAAACIVYALSAGHPAWVAVVLLIIAALTHTFAEVLSQAGAWGLSFELADPQRAGAYQGVFGMGFSLSALAAPLVVNATAIQMGMVGWIILAVVFLGAAVGIAVIAKRAAAAIEREAASHSPSAAAV